jgi:hypothetical protein
LALPGEYRVFIPVFANFPGAGSSQWQTELWVTNRTDTPLVFRLSPCNQSAGCNLPSMQPQESQLYTGVWPTGRWLPVWEGDAIRYQARLRDSTRNASSAGVELPIIGEGDFRSDELNLLAIPRDPKFRVTVRLYARDVTPVLMVEQVDMLGNVLRTDNVLLNDPPARDFNLGASYAQIALDSSPVATTPIRLRIRSNFSGVYFWALASVTNNDTSEVTLIQASR